MPRAVRKLAHGGGRWDSRGAQGGGGEGAGESQVSVSNPARFPVDLHEGAKSGVKSQDVNLSGVPAHDNAGEPDEFFGDEDPSAAGLGFDDP